MSNKDNLVPFSKRSKGEARESGRKGGMASGKARRDKRYFRQVMKALLAMPMTDKEGKEVMSPITGKPMSIREQVATALLYGAIRGDVRKFRVILDILGEGAKVIKQELSGAVQVDESRIDLDKLTETQKNAVLTVGEEVLSKRLGNQKREDVFL